MQHAGVKWAFFSLLAYPLFYYPGEKDGVKEREIGQRRYGSARDQKIKVMAE